jgi:uncharacterized protein YlxP (DUF503 family)
LFSIQRGSRIERQLFAIRRPVDDPSAGDVRSSQASTAFYKFNPSAVRDQIQSNRDGMPIAFLTLELHIEAAQSIKDRRQVVRSLKDRLRTSFNVSVAELDAAELWNRATVGVVSISSSRDYLDGLMKNVERAATRIANNHGADVSDSFVEYF